MPLRIGLLGVAHVHTPSYVHSLRANPEADLVGFTEPDAVVASEFGAKYNLPSFDIADLLSQVDAVILSGTNIQHRPFAVQAAQAGKHILTEKPIATTLADADEMIAAAKAAGVNLMVGFPCRFSPAWARIKHHVQSGALGKILAINATNRGTCPFGWFVEPAKSGGGAMIDHTVHVADLLLDLLGEEPEHVFAAAGNGMYGEAWEDSAMLSATYPGGVFATIDASWSRPKNYKTWGDVTMAITCEKGVLSMDMFGQEMEAYSTSRPYGVRGFGSDLDALMIGEFVASCLEKRAPRVTGEHGRAALRVALLGYASLNAA